MNVTPNTLYHSDCLTLLERTKSEIASLVYLDPPWYTDEGYYKEHMSKNKESRVSVKRLSKEERDKEANARFQEYLVFVSKVIQQSYRILTSKGMLVFHVEPRLSSSVRLLIDEVYNGPQ